MSRAFNAAVRLLFGLPFRDTQCGFKAFRREAARRLFALSRIDGFAFDVELLVAAGRLSLRVQELPVRFDQDALSTVRLVAHAWPVWSELWTIRRQLRSGWYA